MNRNSWPVKVLSELCSITTGNKDVNEGDVQGEYLFFTCAAVPLRSSNYSFEGESILLPGNGANVGMVLYYNGKFEAYQRTYVLNKFSVDVKYVYYHLRDRWKKSQENKQFGSATNYIRFDNIASYKIPIPPLPTQKQIAEILEKADQAKQKRKEANKLTEQFLQSAFIEMFGDPVKNPKGWEVRQLVELVVKFQYGTSIKSSQEGIPVLRIPNIVQGIIDVAELKKVQLSIGEEKPLVLNNGDILFVRTNGNPDFVGRCALFDLKDKFVFASYLIRAIIKQKILDPQFLVYLLGNANYRSVVRSKCSTTAGQFNINTKGLGCLPIILPPLPLQQQFAELVQKTEALKEEQKESEQELENLFNSLMQKAFKGELEFAGN